MGMSSTMLWLCCFTILINIFGIIAVDLLACYIPVRLAFLVKEPSGGVNKNLNPIIFVHSIACAKEYWFGTPQSVADRTGRKVYVIDLRNHGDNEWSDCWNYDINGQDLLHFMDEHFIRQAILIGHSMGGKASMKVALNHPGRVEKLIVEDMRVTVATTLEGHQIAQYVLEVEEATEHVPHYYDFNAAQDYIRDYFYASPVLEITLGISTIPVNKTRYFPIKRETTGGYTTKINVPVLIDNLKSAELIMSVDTGVYSGPAYFIYGTESKIGVIQDAFFIFRCFPNVQFFDVHGSNHAIHNNVPYEFADIVSNFISQPNIYLIKV